MSRSSRIAAPICLRLVVAAGALALIPSCSAESVSKPTGESVQRSLGTETLEPGVTLERFELQQPDGWVQEVWLYRPDPLPDAPVPLAVVPPAGGTLLTAPGLGGGDRPEHLPYVREGYAVVSFTMRGEMPQDPTTDQIVEAAIGFQKGKAGVADARRALALALEQFPAVDPDRTFAVGHSSAGTLALLLGRYEPKIRAVVAFAPVWDVEGHLSRETIESFDEAVPGFADFVDSHSPIRQAADIDVPILHFHSEADETASVEDARIQTGRALELGAQVEFRSVQDGDHYSSMIEEGIPIALEWLSQRP